MLISLRPGRTLGILSPALATGGRLLIGGRPCRFWLAEDVLVFRDVRVFDGTKRHTVDRRRRSGERIEQIGPRASIPEGAKVVDGKGPDAAARPDRLPHSRLLAEHLEQAVVFGVTTELDMFTDQAFAARMRVEEAGGQSVRSRRPAIGRDARHGARRPRDRISAWPIPTITDPRRQAFVLTPGPCRGLRLHQDRLRRWKRDRHPVADDRSQDPRGGDPGGARRKKLAVVHVLVRECPRGDCRGADRARAPVPSSSPRTNLVIRLVAEKLRLTLRSLRRECLRCKKAGSAG